MPKISAKFRQGHPPVGATNRDLLGYKLLDDKPPLKGAWSGSHDPFLMSMPIFKMLALMISLESVKLGTSNYVCWQIQRKEYKCAHDRLPPKDVFRVTLPY